MSKLSFIQKDDIKIAYRFYKRNKKTVIFLHGLMSDMTGSKSNFFNKFCRINNVSFLCFDFRGHGRSSGEITDFGVSDWFNDLKLIINKLKINKPILIGSSMGGWVAMSYALHYPIKVSKLIGIAPAPDFTTELLWKKFTKQQKLAIKNKKIIENKIDKSFSYFYSLNLFKNSKNKLLKNNKKIFKGKTLLFHGSQDNTVPLDYNKGLIFKKNFMNLMMITIKGADHSMSDNDSLQNIIKFI